MFRLKISATSSTRKVQNYYPKLNMEHHFNLGLDFAQQLKGNNEAIIINSDTAYKQNNKNSMSDLFYWNNC